MDTLQQLKDEFEYEYAITKKFFDRFPGHDNDYTPHKKSKKLMPLATHIAEIFGWPEQITTTEVLNFNAGEYKPIILHSKAELANLLESSYKKGTEALSKFSEGQLNGTWSLAMGGKTLASWSKYGALRHALNQITHHRAQLGVYYRLLDIELPGSYGPSADDERF